VKLAKTYSFNTANRNAVEKNGIRHMKEINRQGLSVASGSFPVGSNVRIRNHRSTRGGR
jgi:hypothetical protein